MKITKLQQERVKKLTSYLAKANKTHFKSNLRSRERIGMNRGQLRDAVVILLKLGVLSRYTESSSNYTYTVNLDLL